MRKTMIYVALPASLFGLWLTDHAISAVLVFGVLILLWFAWDVVAAVWRDEI